MSKSPSVPLGVVIGRRPILVTGGAGFIGSNLCDRLAREGRDVLVFDSLARAGVESNLAWLKREHPRRVSALIGDIRDESALREAARDAAAVFHFAAQVAVTSSLVDPVEDFEVNLAGTVRLLDQFRNRPVPFLFASTNKVYGDLGDIDLELSGETYLPSDESTRRYGISEERPISFHTPYGCSKGGADQYVLDYARSYGLPAAVMRMSCIYGQRQFGTEDQGWVAHFVLRALRDESVTLYGDGFQVRDILHVDDAVNAYCAALARIGRIAGQAFNLGGGPANAVSLAQVLSLIEERLGRKLDRHMEDWRQGDQRYYVSDTRRVRRALDLPEPRDWQSGLVSLMDWLEANSVSASAAPFASEAAS